MNLKLTTLLLAGVLVFTLSCKKEAPADQADATTEQSTTTAAADSNAPLSLEEQAAQTYARARRLSEETQGGFVNNPTDTHEKIASRIVRRVQAVTPITEAQQNAILALVKSYPENSIKGKSGRDKRRNMMERAFNEILNDEQRAKVEAALPADVE